MFVCLCLSRLGVVGGMESVRGRDMVGDEMAHEKDMMGRQLDTRRLEAKQVREEREERGTTKSEREK